MSADGSSRGRPTPEPRGTERRTADRSTARLDRIRADEIAVPREARHFQGDRAGFVSRVVANLVDVTVAALTVGALYLGLVGLVFVVNPTDPRLPSTPFPTLVLVGLWVLWLIFTVAWATSGRTFGGKIMGLRVVNFRGQRLLWPGSALRATFCVLFMPGLFWVVVSGENRSLQDTVLRTQVVYDWTHRRKERAEAGSTPAQ
jgi:uncharacterized RDD family membrane protein YckC